MEFGGIEGGSALDSNSPSSIRNETTPQNKSTLDYAAGTVKFEAMRR